MWVAYTQSGLRRRFAATSRALRPELGETRSQSDDDATYA